MLKVNVLALHTPRQCSKRQLPPSGLRLIKGFGEENGWHGKKVCLKQSLRKTHWGSGMEYTTTTLKRKTVVTMVKGELEGRDAEEVARMVADGEDAVAVRPEEIRRVSSFNQEFNKLTKWLATLTTIGVVLWRHDEHALWFALGAVANGGLCKVLKYIINEERPATADGVKVDPGMPSSHAQGFAYLGTYAALALLLWQGPIVMRVSGAIGILMVFAYSSWLRISEGLHTAPQVLVGNALGSITAIFWLWFWKAIVEQAVESSAAFKYLLYGLFALAVVLGYFLSLKDWQFGEP